MTNKNRKHYLLSCAAIMLLSVISCFTIGIVQLACGILISVLLGLQTAKYHYGYVAATASVIFLLPLLITALLSNFSFGSAIVYTALLTAPLILMGLTLGFAANIKLSFYKTVLLLAAIHLIGSLTNIKMVSAANPAFALENIIANSIGQFQAALDAAYSSNPEAIELLKPILGEIAKTMLTLTPAIFTLLSLLTAFINIMLFKALCVKQQVDISFWPSFYNLHADRMISVLFLVIFFLNTFAPEGLFADLTLNVVTILCGIFLLFGISFTDWKMRTRGMKRLQRRLILMVCILFCTSFIMLPPLVFIFLGIADGLFHFRMRKPPKTL